MHMFPSSLNLSVLPFMSMNKFMQSSKHFKFYVARYFVVVLLLFCCAQMPIEYTYGGYPCIAAAAFAAPAADIGAGSRANAAAAAAAAAAGYAAARARPRWMATPRNAAAAVAA